MSKESVLKDISEGSESAFTIVVITFFIIGIIINVFLGLIIIAKLYDVEFALELTRIIKIVFNFLFYMSMVTVIMAVVANILQSLIKYDKKFKEKKKIEFEGFVKSIIDKSKRKK